MQDIAIILQSCIAALAYSFVFYAKKRQKHKGEPFRLKKLLPTLLVGLAVGIAFAQSGELVTQTELETRLAGMAGTIALVESVLKVVVREVREMRENVGPTR